MMLKSILFSAGIIILVMVVFTFCRSESSIRDSLSDDLNHVLDIAELRRENLYHPDYEHLLRLASLRNPPANARNVFNYIDWDRHDYRLYGISLLGANHDVETFFSALQTSYGLYTYLGGDEIFLPIRNAILEIVNTQEVPNPPTRTTWSTHALEDLLVTKLRPVINDGHFTIGRERFLMDYIFFTADARFRLNENGFYNIINGAYVESLELPCIPELYFKLDTTFRLSMCANGAEFFYVPVIYLREQAGMVYPRFMTITYTNEIYETFEILEVIQPERPEHQPPSLEIVQGIPVLTIMAMGAIANPNGFAYEEGRQVMAYVNELRDKPIFIIDLRGNFGGTGSLPLNWFYELLNQNVPSTYVSLLAICIDVQRNFFRGPTHDAAIINRFRPSRMFDDNHRYVNYPPRNIVQNNQLIIILVDRHSASAAEWMTDLAFNITNTLVIGQNTAGVALSGFTSWSFILPHSRIKFNFGSSLTVHTDGHFREGLGYAPDIWVEGDALAAALAMLDNHVLMD